MVNIGIIGAGRIATTHVKALKNLENAQIKAIVDVFKEKAEALAATCGATAYTELDECLNELDIVYICTQPTSRRELAEKIAAAGKHIVCEKPIATTIEDAVAIIDAAEKANVKLMVGFNMRYRDGFMRLKEMIQSGKLGRVISYWSNIMGIVGGAGPGSWKVDPRYMCGMTIESLSHDIDVMRYLVGDPLEVKANIFASRADLPTFDDNIHAIMSLADGTMASFQASWSSPLGMNSRGVIGSEGTAYVTGSGLWDLRELHWKTKDMEHEMVEIIDDNLSNLKSYIEENRHILSCVENGLMPSETGEDGLKVLQISHAVLDSNRLHQVVKL